MQIGTSEKASKKKNSKEAEVLEKRKLFTIGGMSKPYEHG